MKTQKICASILVILICLVSFFMGYTKSFIVPVFADTDFPTGYNPANTDYDLATSFNDYVKSRNANFNGTLPDAANIYILNLMNKGANKLNTNIDSIKNAIAKKSETGGRVIWYLDSTVTQFYNDLFDFLLQDLELEVGDTNVDKLAYSGSIFTDKDGNSCLCYLLQSGNIIAKGTDYKYSTLQYKNAFLNGVTTYTANLTDNTTVNYSINQIKNQPVYRFSYGTGNYNFYSDNPSYGDNLRGSTTVLYDASNNYYYFGSYSTQDGSEVIKNNRWLRIDMTDSESQGQNNITVSFISQEINNNNYEGDTYITNEGDVITNEGDDITYNPYPDGGGSSTGSGTAGGSGSDGTINFPDLNFSLPDINWSLGDLSQKFPFSIPFDLISFFTLINAEPEAPQIDANIPLGSWYTWEFEADFGQFENYAVIVRNVEFIGFCVGLIYITIRLVKG